MEKDEITSWRAYYLSEAEKALKENLPRTARQCLENARIFAKMGITPKKD